MPGKVVEALKLLCSYLEPTQVSWVKSLRRDGAIEAREFGKLAP